MRRREAFNGEGGEAKETAGAAGRSGNSSSRLSSLLFGIVSIAVVAKSPNACHIINSTAGAEAKNGRRYLD